MFFKGNALRQIIVTVSALICSLSLFAQESLNVTGTITDISGEPLSAVSIVVKGTNVGVVSNENGKYSVSVSDKEAVLIFSLVGYATKEITVGNLTIIDVVLAEDVSTLDEIVVIGYGAVRKGNLTSAVSHVSSKDFLNTNSLNPVMQVQGKVAGVTIENRGAGDPNSGASIQIRGVASRSLDTGPLVVVDGILGADLTNINSMDIESIDFLKDGAASAIYGTRGGNGVVIVTTKKGNSDGVVHASYNGFMSFDFINDKLDMLSPEEFVKFRVAGGQAEDYGAKTDWLDAVSKTGTTHNHSLSLSGGTTNFNYRVSLDYKNAKGVDLRSQRQEYGARLALNHKAKNGLYEMTVNLAPRVINRDNASWEAFNQALLMNPTMPVYDPSDPTGKTYFRTPVLGRYNPVEAMNIEEDGTEEKKLNWSATLQVNLLPVLFETPKHTLNTSVTVAEQINDGFSYWFLPAASTRQVERGFDGEASREYSKSLQQSLEWIGNYQFKSGGHTAGLVGGYSYQYFPSSSLKGASKNFTNDWLKYNNLADGTYQYTANHRDFGASSNKSDSKLIAFFGRVNYDYQGKYLFTTSLRYEGSSKFGDANKWGYFPAASVGWRISQENFMESVSWVNDLKLRADYGETGNQNFESYLSLPVYTSANDMVIYNGQLYRGWVANANSNANLKWEKGINWNVGLDFSLFDHRLTGSVNYYSRKQKDLLGNYNVPKPPYLYLTTFVNVGTMKNTGVEMELNIKAVETKDFSYNIGLIGATCNNEFVSFSNDMYKGEEFYETAEMRDLSRQAMLQQQREGQRIGTFYLIRWAGVADDGQWLVYNKDNVIIPIAEASFTADRQKAGNGMPKFTASFNNTFRYKNLDASIYFRGVFGYDIFNVHDFYYGMPTAAGNENTLKKAYYENAKATEGYNAVTDYFLEKGDYVKLDVVSLGYTYRVKSKWIDSFRVYATARNLATFTSFSGVDPESYPINGLTPGFVENRNYYPSTTQMLFGVQLNF
jgi:TonB-linked SusC/RagA family outer membrane protein